MFQDRCLASPCSSSVPSLDARHICKSPAWGRKPRVQYLGRLPVARGLQSYVTKSHRLKSPLERPANSLSDGSEVGPSPKCLRNSKETGRPLGGLRGCWEGLKASQSLSLWGVAAGGGFLASASFLETPASFVEAIAILGGIVAVHEAGHFLAARIQNIHVTKFAIGFGPPILKYQGPEVEYTIRAFPLGGFVAFPDDDIDNPYPEDDPDLFRNRSIPQRALVISAGVLANFLFAFIILFTQVTVVGVTKETFEPGVKVAKVFENTVAQKAGLLPGDLIMEIGKDQLSPGPAAVSRVVSKINENPEVPIPFIVARDGTSYQLSVSPELTEDGKGRIGMQLEANSRFTRQYSENLGAALVQTSQQFLSILKDMVYGLQQIIFNFSQTSEQVSGPVAIVAVGAEVARVDASRLFTFAAVINMNLAVVNILPLPALDGGYLALLLLEALRGGKKLPEGVEQGVMASGLVFLMAVGLSLIVRDTVNLGGF